MIHLQFHELALPLHVILKVHHNKGQAVITQALQKRLQESERTIAVQTQQIEVLSSQLEALKQIDQEMNRPPRKRHPIP